MSDYYSIIISEKNKKLKVIKQKKMKWQTFSISTLRIFPGGFYINFLTTAHTHAQMSTKY